MKILVTGASGFIGSFLVEEALNRGDEVWAGVRATSSRRYLKDSRIHFATLDFSHKEMLEDQLQKLQQQMEGWDVIIHAAGVTKCKDPKEFMEGNFVATRHLVETLITLQMVPRQFIYLSSLSILGPIHETDGQPLTVADVPQPNTAYGVSKRASEEYLLALKAFPLVIFRPTGVYGPREKDYFLMAKSIKQHLDFAVGFKRQDLTFIYVKDVVQAVYRAIDRQVVGRSYLLSDGRTYLSRSFSDYIQKELGVKGVLHITCPLGLLKVLSHLIEKGAKMMGKSSTLNRDKYKIMKQRNWKCDIAPAQEDLGYQPEYDLERGVKESITWYKNEKWL